MAFSQASITDGGADRQGADLRVWWDSSDPEGTIFQVYLGRRLTWTGTKRAVVLPYPTHADGGEQPVDIGTVGPGEGSVDFSSSLPALPYDNRVRLTWHGGSYLSESILGFRIYRGAAAGGAVAYTTPSATVAAYPGGRVIDGAGIGEAGYGGAGLAASNYAWVSPPLGPGTWHFGIKAYDAAGNLSTADETTYAVTAPPRPPAADAQGLRLRIDSYDDVTGLATLVWLASPSY